MALDPTNPTTSVGSKAPVLNEADCPAISIAIEGASDPRENVNEEPTSGTEVLGPRAPAMNDIERPVRATVTLLAGGTNP